MKMKKVLSLALVFTMITTLFVVAPMTVTASTEVIMELHPDIYVGLDDSGVYWSSAATGSLFKWTGGAANRPAINLLATPVTNILFDTRTAALINRYPTGDPATINESILPNTNGSERGASRHRFGLIRFNLMATPPGSDRTYKQMINDGDFESIKFRTTPTGEHASDSSYVLYTLTPAMTSYLDDESELKNYGTARELGYTTYTDNLMLQIPTGIAKDVLYTSGDKMSEIAAVADTQNYIGFVVTLANEGLGRLHNLRMVFEKDDPREQGDFSVAVGNHSTDFDKAKLTVSGAYDDDKISVKFTSNGNSSTVVTKTVSEGASNSEDIFVDVPMINNNDDTYSVEVTITNVMDKQAYNNTFTGKNYHTTKVVFNGNAGSVENVPAGLNTVQQGTTINKPAPDPTRESYYFTGWYTEPAAENEWVFASEQVTYAKTTNGVLNLYAGWSAAKLQGIVNYDANGGVGTVAPTAAFIGEAASYSHRADLTKEGFTFTGWNTQADGHGTHYDAGSTYMVASSTIDLFAEWVPALKAPLTIETLRKVGDFTDRGGDSIYDVWGNLYVAAREISNSTVDNVIRIISPDGKLVQEIGTRASAVPTESSADGKYSEDFVLGRPRGIVFDSAHNLYFTESIVPGKIRMITNSNPNPNTAPIFDEDSDVITLFTSITDTPVAPVENNGRLRALGFDREQNLFFATDGNKIFKLENANTDKTLVPDLSAYGGVDPLKTPIHIAGTGATAITPSETAYNEPKLAIEANMFAIGFTFDGENNLWVADGNNHRIRKMDLETGIMTTMVGNRPASPGHDNYRAGTLGNLTDANGPRCGLVQQMAYDKVNNVIYAAGGNDYGRVYILDLNADSGNNFRVYAGTTSNTGTVVSATPQSNLATARFANGQCQPWGVAVNKWGDVAVQLFGGTTIARMGTLIITKRTTITYDGNGITPDSFSDPIPTFTAKAGTTATIADYEGITSGDANVIDWNTAAGGGGTSYMSGTTLKLDRTDLTLYAVWGGEIYNENNQKLTFNNLADTEEIVLRGLSDTSIAPYIALYDAEKRLINVVCDFEGITTNPDNDVMIELKTPIGNVPGAVYARILIWADSEIISPTGYSFTLR